MNLRKFTGAALIVIPFAVIVGFTVAAKGATGALLIWGGAIIGTAMLLGGIRLLTGQPIR